MPYGPRVRGRSAGRDAPPTRHPAPPAAAATRVISRPALRCRRASIVGRRTPSRRRHSKSPAGPSLNGRGGRRHGRARSLSSRSDERMSREELDHRLAMSLLAIYLVAVVARSGRAAVATRADGEAAPSARPWPVLVGRGALVSAVIAAPPARVVESPAASLRRAASYQDPSWVSRVPGACNVAMRWSPVWRRQALAPCAGRFNGWVGGARPEVDAPLRCARACIAARDGLDRGSGPPGLIQR